MISPMHNAWLPAATSRLSIFGGVALRRLRYPYAYPPYYSSWFGPAVTLGFFGRAGPGFHHGFFHHGFHRG